jgi:hypothetical protein
LVKNENDFQNELKKIKFYQLIFLFVLQVLKGILLFIFLMLISINFFKKIKIYLIKKKRQKKNIIMFNNKIIIIINNNSNISFFFE